MKECMKTEVNTLPGLHYNYVILFAGSDFWKAVFGQKLYECENVHICQGAFEGSIFLKKLFKVHWAYRLNSRINLPLKSIWFRKIYRQNFPTKKPLCFVYLGGNSIRFDGGLTDYIRRQSPQNRQVILHMDLISKKCNYDYKLIRQKVDEAITYDRNEAEKYGIHWYPTRIYGRKERITEPKKFDFDLYFLGAAKDRLEQIIEVYDRVSSAGLRCCFLLAGVPKEKQEQRSGIRYIDGITYEENLQYVQRTKCILEISQKGTDSNTLRLDEAVTYHRKLLTNCGSLKEKDYFIPRTMSIFSSVEEIDTEFLKEPIPYDAFSERNIDFSPQKLIRYIDNLLVEQGKEDGTDFSHCTGL